MNIVGQSQAIKNLKELILKVADTEATVLICGESGTGKELVANLIHQTSSRAKEPFLPINCGAIPSELLETELFGHEKGAFTGAISNKAGKFEVASNGTIFLDEIGDMPLEMQVKLLRVLQEKKFSKVGGNELISTNSRIIAATNQNLEELVKNNKFREDLFYRINVVPITIPPLRDRKEDIDCLIENSIKILKEKNLQLNFSDDALDFLIKYDWPGNIRELHNLLERVAVLHNDELINVDIISKHIVPPTALSSINIANNVNHLDLTLGFDLKEYLEKIEVCIINKALNNTNNVVTHAAKNLGLRRTTLIEKIKKYQINK